MSCREKLDNILDELNEDILKKIALMLEDMPSMEKYNKNTLPERIEELKELERKKVEEERQERENRIANKQAEEQVLKERYRQEFKIIGRTLWSASDNLDLLKAIDFLNDTSYWKIIKAFEWGIIQGKRAERARRKRGNK